MKTVRLFLLSLVAVILAAATCLAAEPDPRVKAELTQMLSSYSEAFNKKDVDAVMAFYTPDAVLMGTGPGERYDGPEGIREAYLQFVQSYDKQTSERTWLKVWANGDVAWGMTMVQYTTYNKNVKSEFAVNNSVVLEKRNGKWLFVSHHFSTLVRN